MIPKKTTKMIVKDEIGNLVQLLPEINVELNVNEVSNEALSNSALANALDNINNSLPESIPFDIKDEEPNASNTTDLDEALIAWVPSKPSWSITINTELAGEGEKIGQIPFRYVYDDNDINDIIYDVDWGDGNNITYYPQRYDYDNSNYMYNDHITHVYAEPGIYTITISSNEFHKVCISQPFEAEIYRLTLISINSAFPKIAGTYGWYWYEDAYGSCFGSFYACFHNCISLQSIPEDLFYNNLKAGDFDDCFNGCTSLQSIPANLFKNNVIATEFIGCFDNCTAIGDFTLYIDTPDADKVWGFISNKEDVNRTIYVPEDSTSYYSFEDYASSLGFTVVGI